MAKNAPGKHYREGISILDLIKAFPDDAAAEKWFIKTRWPQGPHCPSCGSVNIQERSTRKPQPYRCRDCRKDFSLKTGTLMQGSKLGFQTWAIAIYLVATGLNGVSSMKLHRDLGVTQKTAWHLAHRIRETWCKNTPGQYAGPVEVDETFIGGKRKIMSLTRRKELKGRGHADKTIVIGAKDRSSNRVEAAIVENTDKETLQKFVSDRVNGGGTVYTDDFASYRGMPFEHEAVNHGVGEYVRGMAHTNGIESFWAMLKRGYQGTYHHMSKKHLGRYVNEFAGRHNDRKSDTLDQMASVVRGMDRRQLKYRDLIS